MAAGGFSNATLRYSSASRLRLRIIKPLDLALKADFEKLALGKEALQLHDSVLRAIGPMNHIEHNVHAKVASDRSFCSLPGISRTHEFAHQSDSIWPGQRQSYHRAGLHERFQVWIKGPIQDMGIVFGELIIRKQHHLAADNLQAGCLKSINHIAAMAIRKAIRLKQYKSRLHQN
jgi:hypothetical protein